MSTRGRQDEIAAHAADLFRARGYHGVGINEIAAAAGITGPALYRHFADKQAILFHVVASGLRDLETATAEALSAAGSPSEHLAALLNAVAAASVDRRDVAALWRWEGWHLQPPQQREIARRSSATLAAWSKLLFDVRPDLTTDADADLLSWAVLSVFGSVSVHRASVAKRRFVALLVEIAQRVAHVSLPAQSPEAAATAQGIGTHTRREQILSAAADLFHRYGFRAVSMEDIGAAAGIAGPSVYRHFPSKAGLLCAIARRAADRLAIGAEHALRVSSSEPEALRRLVESYVQVLTGPPELAVAFSIDTANVGEQDRAELVRMQRDYVVRWVDLLVASRPELGVREARISVHAALTIANDLVRTRRTATRPHLAAELLALMTAALGLDRP